MSTKTKAPKAPKTTAAKPDAQRAKAVAVAQARDAAANAPAAASPKTKPAKAPKAPKEAKPRKVSGLDAAFAVLKAKGEPMTCQAIVDAMLAKGMWKTNGKTPAATIYSAMLREIDGKPGESRFEKTGRGLFAIAKTKG